MLHPVGILLMLRTTHSMAQLLSFLTFQIHHLPFQSTSVCSCGHTLSIVITRTVPPQKTQILYHSNYPSRSLFGHNLMVWGLYAFPGVLSAHEVNLHTCFPSAFPCILWSHCQPSLLFPSSTQSGGTFCSATKLFIIIIQQILLIHLRCTRYCGLIGTALPVRSSQSRRR